MAAALFILAPLMLAAATAAGPCLMKNAVYGQADSALELTFAPVADAVTVSNAFTLRLKGGVALDGIVQWPEGAARPYGMLMYNCPQGDVTGEEIAACTPWQGVIYAVDGAEIVGTLPSEDAAAPPSLILPDLGPSLQLSPAYAAAGLTAAPWDAFQLKGCGG